MMDRTAGCSGPKVIGLLWIVLQFKPTESLQCYSCDSTFRPDVHSANIGCLANGTETQCQDYQDRCYSYVAGESTVEKGCTSALNCIGNRICCQTDFCNGGYGANLKTGFGQPCEGEASCVQDGGMVCGRDITAEDQSSRCLCADGWFPWRAACFEKSGIGEVCHEDSHCLLDNSFCQYQQCQCASDFYPNLTQQECQLKLAILSDCTSSDQCRARNSLCVQRCVCDVGYLYDQFSGHCSGACGVLWLTSLWAVVFIPMVTTITNQCF
ncbi:uncharacterized protein LOC143285807 [Babylonia areolata]|uniref:uncharacterized protein LOC143285807 n=1 Tax=Babylonia areolata TaxID=304850 RepID=UPI003FD676C2